MTPHINDSGSQIHMPLGPGRVLERSEKGAPGLE